MSKKDTSSIVTRSLTIVDILASSGRAMSYSEVLAASGFAKSSTHRLLSILQNEGVIEFDERDKSYGLGKRLRAWARQSWINSDLQHQSANELEKLCESCGHNVCLMGMDGAETFCRLRTVTCTARKQSWSVIETLMKSPDQLIAEMCLA